MAKHIFIPLLRNPNAALRINVEHFANNVTKLRDNPRPLVHWPTAWFDAALVAHGHDGLIEVTPRGADLLASIDSIPDDPEPEVKVTTCSKCNGSGEQPFFMFMETCDRCKGSKAEPRFAGIDFNTPTAGSDVTERASEHPWVLIDSEEVAQQFVGKRVEVDADMCSGFGRHDYHHKTEKISTTRPRNLLFYRGDCIDWFRRGNVRLRLADGDLS